MKIIKEQGFEVLVIWHNDYIAFPEKTIDKCINFITEGFNDNNKKI